MLDIVIMTFILTFVFYHLKKYALIGLARTPLRRIPAPVVQILVYVGVIALLTLFIIGNASIIMKQIGDISTSFSGFNIEKFLAGIDPNLISFVSRIDFDGYIQQAGQAILGGLANLGGIVLNVFIAFILSFLFVLEKDKIVTIARTLRNSRIEPVYRYFAIFFKKFCNTFGKVMKVQVLIAACNSAIFAVYMIITGFPYIIVLSMMIFLFSLIPVMGAILSAIPLLIIALSTGGLMKAAQVLIMIVVIQAVEAYTLEPKLMSRSTSLPVSLVFVILIISQHYLGAWGMLIGIPFFIFVMDALNIDYGLAMKPKK